MTAITSNSVPQVLASHAHTPQVHHAKGAEAKPAAAPASAPKSGRALDISL